MSGERKTHLIKVRCPRCGTMAPYQGNPDRPFCSDRCRKIDLGAWADESYRIPVAGPAADANGDSLD
ncbi:MAG: DNA gyrase inhibitor YacG [Deltaproteobacteria bacterium]|nr:MAG: DNA gyrase inhibitor YacG [Deltaproteobacteria bacterium]